MSSQSSFYTRLMRWRSWIRWWELWFYISGIIFVALLCIFYILSMSRLKYGDRNCTACSRCGPTRDLYNGRICCLFSYLKFVGKFACLKFAGKFSYLKISLFIFATSGLLWWWFSDPAVDMLSTTVDWTCYCCIACCLVRCVSQNIYHIEIHSSSSYSSSISSSIGSSRTDRWVHFQQNAGLPLFVHTWFVHGIDDC